MHRPRVMVWIAPVTPHTAGLPPHRRGRWFHSLDGVAQRELLARWRA